MIARAAKLGGYGACLGLFGLATAAQVWVWYEDANYRLNTTPSMQVGLWAVSRHAPEPAQIRRGEIVSVCLPLSVGIPARLRGYVSGGECPGQTTPMLKTIAAVPGDTVTVSTRGMAVNGQLLPHSQALEYDEKHRPLSTVPAGTYVVPPTIVWLYASHDPRSFDSRYYGGIPERNMMGDAWPLLVMR
jgi:conjugative transfer signal peptidase TraF